MPKILPADFNHCSDSRRRLWVPALCALLALISARSHADPVMVRIESGALAGTVIDGIQSFKGIPYAAAPIGDLRWRAPRPPASWGAVREASDFGPSCPQARPPQRVPAGSAAEKTSEDCLMLNVWAPATTAKRAPVMVWIHGGGNIQGSGSGTYTDGTAFARDGIVLVTFNYRLGLLGFFAHPALIREAGKEPVANFGLLDQIAVLQWVQGNIAAFGGDPTNVTVFGESAGAEDVLALMTAATSKGLFQRAIAESAGLWDVGSSLRDAESAAANAASTLGLPGDQATMSQLRQLPADRLAQQASLSASGLIVGDDLLRRSPLLALASGEGRDVPLIIGFNNNEGSLLGSESELLQPVLPHIDLASWRSVYGAAADSDATLSRLLFRDAAFAEPARWLATHRGGHSPTYVYHFDYILSLLRARRGGADHGSEIPYVFSSWNFNRLTPEDRQITALVHSCWVAFARSGVPTCEGVPQWLAYRPEAEWLMEFADQATVQKASDDAILDAIHAKLWSESGSAAAAAR
jgi:para-nitrobenzyl esterase